MREIEVGFSSFQVNAALALVLDIVIVLFGQNVYCEYVNAACRRKLLAGKAVLVSGQERKYSFLVFSILILAFCTAIEVGFEGQSIGALYTKIHPLKSATLQDTSSWKHSEFWNRNISNVTLSDFEPTEDRRGCFQVDSETDNDVEMIFNMYGNEGCYRFLPMGLDAHETGMNMRFVDISLHSQNYYVVLNPNNGPNFLEDFGNLTFPFENRNVTQFSVRLSASIANSILVDDTSTQKGERESGYATFSVLTDWTYTRIGPEDSIIMIIATENDLVLFQVVSLTDIFLPKEVNGIFDFSQKRKRHEISLFQITTHSLMMENSGGELKKARVEKDPPELTVHKLYYALSKLHFAMEPNQRTSLSFGLQLVSAIDERESSRETEEVAVRIPLVDGTNTEISLYSPICFTLVTTVLLLLKIYFVILRKVSPISVEVFDLRYITMLKLSHLTAKRIYCKPWYDVILTIEDGELPTLRMKEDRDNGTEVSLSSLTTKS